ncbi:MAG: PAS domain S-box protein, partial [Campylobacterota bacterium]|nr:PAS domain S-box protein [Campylobacterota bacterium]
FMNKLLNIMPIPVFIKDENFRYIKCNDAFCDFLNLSKDEIVGKSVYDLAPNNLADEYHKKDLELLKVDKQYYKSEVKKINSDMILKVEFHKASYYHNHKFTGILGVIVDITEQEDKKLELEMEIATKTIANISQTKQFEDEQLKNIKFTAIGQLAAGITHEINTPLTYVKGNFEMIKYDILDLPNNIAKERMLEDCEKVMDGINRLSNIVESMREMSQKSKEAKEDTNIYHTLITSLTLLYNRSKQISNIKVNGELFTIGFDKDKEIYLCCVQKQRVEQTWVIIINNALDELVKVDNFEDRLIDVNINCTNDNRYIVIKIKDNAGGIPKNIINNIFDPFVSSKESSGM